jgi:peptidoglycan-N-acetylglucosamine deacetylase
MSVGREARDLALGLSAGVLGAYWLPAAAGPCPPLRPLLGVHDRIPASDRVLLTFDDGPHPQGTPAVLEALREHGATATFFLVGEQVARWPTLAAEIAAAGHEIGLHGYRHRCLLFVTPWRLRDDLRRAEALIMQAAEYAPKLYRPPYGILTSASLVAARAHGWQPMLWSRHGLDWAKSATPASVAGRLTRGLRGGDVLLLHDADHYAAHESWRTTAAATPRILEAATAAGLTV